MAVQKSTSGLAKKLGPALDQAVKAHAKDDTTYGIIDLPGGISNGVARVQKCYFKEFDKTTNMKKADGSSAAGEYFFRCEGMVVRPLFVLTPGGEVPVKGLTTSVMIPLCDTKSTTGNETTLDQNLAKILNVMRQLAGPEYTEGASAGDLESLAAGIEEARPYFWFSTSESNPKPGSNQKPRVFENWHGNKGLEDFQEEDPTLQMKDRSGDGAGGKTTQTAVGGKQPPKQPPTTTTTADDDNKGNDNEFDPANMSLEELVELASSDADSAQVAKDRLEELAVEQGWTKDDVENAESWAAVADMVNNPKQDETAVEFVPEKGKTAKFSPPDVKNKGKFLSERDVQVVSVDTKKKLATVKDIAAKKEYKDVAWSDLS